MQTNGTSKSPEEMRAWYFSEISKGVGYSNEEIFRNSWKLDADYARGIYECCLTKPEYLKHYLRNEKALSRLLPAVLGAFSSKCALCGWDANRRSEIRKALKSAEGVMFPMPETRGLAKSGGGLGAFVRGGALGFPNLAPAANAQCKSGRAESSENRDGAV